MLTRRQARLLGLTSGKEGGSGSPASPQSPTGHSVGDAVRASADLPASSSTGAAPATHLVLHLGTSSTSASAPRGGGVGGEHVNAFFGPSATALSLTAINASAASSSAGTSGASGVGGRGRLGARQVEAMRLGAQAAVEYWAAASTTAGPSIRLAAPHGGAWPTSCAFNAETAASAYSPAGSGAVSGASPASAKASNGSSGRPAQLSAAQLRIRWRAVTRNCSSLVVPAKLTASTAINDSGAGRASTVADAGANGNGSHTLVLSRAAVAARPASPPPSETSAWAEATRGTASSSSRSDAAAATLNGIHHDDRTHAGPEVASRRSLTFFTAPFCADAPLPAPAIAAYSLSASNALGETRPGSAVGASTRRAPTTALALRQQKEAARTQRQHRLSHEVYNQVYVKAHEARMRLLFGLGDGGESRVNGHAAAAGGDEGDDTAAAGEAAYLQTLDASTEEEGRVLRVIASIDAALHRQLAAAYRHPSRHPPAPSRAEACPPASASQVLPTTRKAGAAAFAARRPAILEAVIADATDGVEAFTHRLLPYQQEGVRWLLRLNVLEHMNGILADDMGLGKTAQTVVYLSCFKDLVEEVVQRPLDVLRRRHARLCQRALGLTAATSAQPWPSAAPRGPQAKDPARGGAGAGAAESLPPWLTWSEGSLNAATAGDDGAEPEGEEPGMVCGGGAEAPVASSSPELAAARACGSSIRLVKHVKHWLWQLDDGLGDAVASSRAPRQCAPQHVAGHKRSAEGDSERDEEGVDADGGDDVEGVCSQTNPSAVPASATQAPVVVRRRRGRPPKHLSAMMAAAAATATPIEVGSAGLAQTVAAHTTVPVFSPAVNEQLETAQRTFRPVLIIAPLSTLPHWADEFRRFSGRGAGMAERFTVYVLNAARTERETRMASFLQHVERLTSESQTPCGADGEAGVSPCTPVLVIPHDMLTKPLSGALRQIRRVDWHVVVIDEAQRIKSARSTLFKKVCELRCLSRLVLTGTPVQNNTTELFSLLRFLAPQSFASSDLFEQLDSALLAASRSSALEDRELHILLCRRVHRLLMPFILRREKSILKTALPPMRDYAVLCPLLPFQRAQLAEVEAKAQAGALSGNPHIQYRKILLHPYTTQAFFYVNEEVVRTSGKLLVLDFMMGFLQRTRHKFLVFCGWTLVLDVVETLCGMRGIPYVRLDGRTPVEQREANIRGFNTPMPAVDDDAGDRQEGRGVAAAGSEAAARPRRLSRRLGASTAAAAAGGASGSSGARPSSPDADGSAGDEDEAAPAAPAPCCFLISKVAGGVGLNLQAADTVFLLDVDYNPQRDAQALSRVYRVGQTKEVRVFRLVIDHPIERDVVAIHEAKDNLGRAIVQAGRYDLHSSVQEREAALQHLFRAGTLSQLSRQWAAATTADDDAGAMEKNRRAAERSADTNEESGDREEEEEGNDDLRLSCQGDSSRCDAAGVRGGDAGAAEEEARVPSPSPAFPLLPTVAALRLLPKNPPACGPPAEPEPGDGDDVAAPARTPTDLHRVIICDAGVVPVLPPNPMQPVKAENAEETGVAVSQLPPQHSQLAFSSTSSTSPYLSASTTASGELLVRGEGDDEQLPHHRGGHDGAPTAAAPQRRRRRHISFKLEDDSSAEGRAGKWTAEGDGSGVGGGSVLCRTSPPPSNADDAEPRTPSPPRELQPAEHLLAMRERLEEVLLRRDGEWRVLDEMFRAVQASLRIPAAAV